MQSIANFLQTYRQGRVVITNKVSYNTRDLIEEIVRLRHAQFIDPTFADGSPKIFYNIGWAMSDNIYKHTVIGTKDIQLHSTNYKGSKIVGLLKMAVKSFLKWTMFGEIADDARKELIDMGHVVMKVAGNKPYQVNLLNLIVPPNANELQDTSFVEQIQLNYEQMLQMKDRLGKHWSEIEQLWEYMQGSGRSYFTIYEYWHREDFEENGEICKGCTTYLDRSYIPEDMVNDPAIWSPYLEIEKYKTPFTKKIRSKKVQKELRTDEEYIYPYTEKRLFKLQGRWLGLGMYELVRGIIEHINQNLNLKRKFDELQFRGILVHKQPSMGSERTLTQEFLESIPSGGVIDVVNDEDLRRLDLGTVTYDALQTNDALMQLTKMILGIAENIAGTETKSGVTATAIQANTNLAETTYGIVIRQMSFLLRDLFQDFLLEQILDEMTMEDWIAVTGDPKELIAFDELLIENRVQTVAKQAVDNHQIVTDSHVEELRQVLKKQMEEMGDVRWVEIKKTMLKDIDLMVEFYIDKENFDAQAQITNIEAMLGRQTLTLNREELEREQIELMGLDSKKLVKTEQQKMQEQQAIMMQQQAGQSMPTP